MNDILKNSIKNFKSNSMNFTKVYLLSLFIYLIPIILTIIVNFFSPPGYLWIILNILLILCFVISDLYCKSLTTRLISGYYLSCRWYRPINILSRIISLAITSILSIFLIIPGYLYDKVFNSYFYSQDFDGKSFFEYLFSKNKYTRLFINSNLFVGIKNNKFLELINILFMVSMAVSVILLNSIIKASPYILSGDSSYLDGIPEYLIPLFTDNSMTVLKGIIVSIIIISLIKLTLQPLINYNGFTFNYCSSIINDLQINENLNSLKEEINNQYGGNDYRYNNPEYCAEDYFEDYKFTADLNNQYTIRYYPFYNKYYIYVWSNWYQL